MRSLLGRTGSSLHNILLCCTIAILVKFIIPKYANVNTKLSAKAYISCVKEKVLHKHKYCVSMELTSVSLWCFRAIEDREEYRPVVIILSGDEKRCLS